MALDCPPVVLEDHSNFYEGPARSLVRTIHTDFEVYDRKMSPTEVLRMKINLKD